jgi:hypothetical protein
VTRTIASAVVVLFVDVVLAAGCGDSKPEFCSNTDDLRQALSTLKDDVTSGNVSAINSDAQTVNTEVDAVTTSAKSDFPNETSAVQSSVSTLTSTIHSLPSSPSVSDLAQLVGDVRTAVTAVDNFKTATSSACD